MENCDFQREAAVSGGVGFGETERVRRLLSPREADLSFDEEGLRSFVPLVVASGIAALVPGGRVLDLFCGVGGCAIGFASAGKRVVAFDIDGGRLARARANAAAMGVADRISFVRGDALAALSGAPTLPVFMDPPWGRHRDRASRYRLADFPLDVCRLLETAMASSPLVVLKLPWNFVVDDLRTLRADVEIDDVFHPLSQTRPFVRIARMRRQA